MLIHRTLAIAITGLILSACERGGAPLTDQDRNAIRTTIANFDKAMLTADLPKLVGAYTEDAVLFPPNAPMLQGREAIQKFFEGLPKFAEFKQSVTEIEGQGEFAYPWGTYETATLPPGAKAPLKDQGKILAVWRRQADGSWLASRVSWNSDITSVR